MGYDKDKAVAYAHQWAYGRNSKYYNFDHNGGDCTNFTSQCIYAGCDVMNYTKDTGWYYISTHNRAAAWTSVEFLYKFLTSNKGKGPYASELALSDASQGDIVQLSFDGLVFSHSLLLVGFDRSTGDILVAAHNDDSDNRPLSSYQYKSSRLLHIEGVIE